MIPVIIALSVAAYWNSLHTPFQYDDLRLIHFNFSLRELSNWKSILWSELFRPLTTFSFALNFRIGQQDPFTYHIVNLCLHITAVTWFYLLLRHHANRPFLPCIAAGLMAVHPLATESVTYISSRSILLCANFYFLAMLAFDSYLRNSRWYHLTAAVFCFILGLLSKEEAAVIPGAFLLYDLLFYKSAEKRVPLYLSLFGFVAGSLLLRLHYFEIPRPFTISQYFSTEVNVWLRYLWLAIYPVSLNVDPEVEILNFRSSEFWLSVFIILLLVICLFRVRKSHPFLAFWGVWFFLNLLVSSSFLPLNSFMAEHRAYISLFGFCSVFAYVAVGWPSVVRPSKLIVSALFLLLIFYGVSTWIRNVVWKDPYTLWRDAAQKSPTKPRAHLNLAKALLWRNQYPEAVREFQFVGALIPDSPLVYEGLGFCYLRTGNLQAAHENFRHALALDKNLTNAKVGLGMAFYEGGDCASALPLLEEVFPRRQESTLLAGLISDCHLRAGNYDKAIHWLLQAIRIEPGNPQLYMKLLRTYARSGDSEKTWEFYARFKSRLPSDSTTKQEIARILADIKPLKQ